jgi:Protein of unknown function (DUF3761)
MTPRAIAVLITSVIMSGLFFSSFHHTEPYPLHPAVSMPPASSASANICAVKCPSTKDSVDAYIASLELHGAPIVIGPTPMPVAVAPAPDSQLQGSGLCAADYYRNSSGNCVHRPEQAPARPAGATAKCSDGAYSFSQHRQGTCSGHGGVAQWL